MPEEKGQGNGAVVAVFFLMLLLISPPTFGPREKVGGGIWWLVVAFGGFCQREWRSGGAPSVKPAGPGPKPDSSHLRRPVLPTTLLSFN